MTVYLCARYGRVEEMRAVARVLDAHRVGCCSRWLWTDNEEEAMTLPARGAMADECLEDIRAADVVVAFTEPADSPYSRGGRHVELGYALALRKPVVILGPVENIFCALPWVFRCASLDTLLVYLRQRALAGEA